MNFAMIALWFAMVYFRDRFPDLNLMTSIKQAGSPAAARPPYPVAVYMLFAPGTPYRNDYGDIRPSTTWEKCWHGSIILIS